MAFHPACSPMAAASPPGPKNTALRSSDASPMFTRPIGDTSGFPRCASANTVDSSTDATTGPTASARRASGNPRNSSSSKMAASASPAASGSATAAYDSPNASAITILAPPTTATSRTAAASAPPAASPTASAVTAPRPAGHRIRARGHPAFRTSTKYTSTVTARLGTTSPSRPRPARVHQSAATASCSHAAAMLSSAKAA